MALVNFTGFEMGDATENYATSGTMSIQGSTVLSGSYALRANPTTTATGFARLGGLDAAGTGGATSLAGTAYGTFWFRYATKPGSGTEELGGLLPGLSSGFRIRINSSGNLSAWDANEAQLGSDGATVLSANTWYRIDISRTKGNSAAYELKINGVTELSGTGDMGNFNNTNLALGKITNRNGQSVDFFYDNAWYSDSGYAPADFEVKRMAPDGNGNYTAWTGDYTNVDEVPHNGDTGSDYINTATSGNAETVTLVSGATAGISGTVHAVKSCAICKEPASVTSANQVRLRSGSTDDDTTSLNLTTTYVLQAKLYETDPATSAAWVLSALDSVEVGVESNASVTVRCTALCAMVAYTPPAAGHPAQRRHGMHGQSFRPVEIGREGTRIFRRDDSGLVLPQQQPLMTRL